MRAQRYDEYVDKICASYSQRRMLSAQGAIPTSLSREQLFGAECGSDQSATKEKPAWMC